MQRQIYINNKELLAEIHKSKVSYCEFEKREHADFDAIVNDITEITPDLIKEVRAKKAVTLTPKKAPPVDPETIPVESLVFRCMTFDHIPIDPLRKRKARNGVNHTRTTFPPFKHYIMEETGLREVCRSHWRGDFETGTFAPDRGKISDMLARMFMLLVERYSRRRNWRGYCVDTATEALTKRGWLNHDQITVDDTILSFENGELKWSPIKALYKDHYEGNMFHLTVEGMDALVTPGHRFVTKQGLRPVELLRESDSVIMTGAPENGPQREIHSDALVELVGWVATEGTIYETSDRNYKRIDIYQNEGPYADRIRKALHTLAPSHGDNLSKTTRRFNLPKAVCEEVVRHIEVEGKALRMDFILSLSQRQRMLLIETMIDADGHRHGALLRYAQKNDAHTDAFIALCTLAGLRTSVKKRTTNGFGGNGRESEINQITIFSSRFTTSRVENIDFHGGKRNGAVKGRGKETHPNEPTVAYNDLVWCPLTDYGCFAARRSGYVYLTGNSYVDEMQSHAMLQLAQIGLQFDESKSDNPFAFYTTAIKNCFTRILNLERKAQNIRDDLLIMAGATPSYTRQISDELEAKIEVEGETNGVILTKKKPGVRGRPKSTTPKVTK